MSENVQMTYDEVEISINQLIIKSLRFGTLAFVPTDPRISESDCEKCTLKDEPECAKAPCSEAERNDKMSGHWLKHNEKFNAYQK